MKIYSFSFLLLFIIFFSCSTKNVKSEFVDSSTVEINVDSTKLFKIIQSQIIDSNVFSNQFYINFNQYKFEKNALIIAGIQNYTEINNVDSTIYKKYKINVDTGWVDIERIRYNKVKAWRDAELKEFNQKNKLPVIYPFSGPDILNAIILFPNATNYYLFSLEEVGSLPDFNKMNHNEEANYFNSIEFTLNDLFNKSYFVSQNITSKSTKTQINGVLPLLTIFLKRTGHEIIDIQSIAIDDRGYLIPDDKYKSVLIVFKDKLGHYKTLTYLKGDISNMGLKKNKKLTLFIDRLPNSQTYLKAASYLLHYNDFSMIKDVILEKSYSILQDDSGLPYKYLNNPNWNITLYGRYVRAVKAFSGINEPKLKAAYEADPDIKALPFDLGYNVGTKYNNLLWAIKK